jgi:protein-histidine pros-kinase
MPEILARMKALAETLAGPELLARIVETLADPVVVVDEDGSIILFNAQAELLFGYHRSEVLGQKVEMLAPETRREAHVGHRTGFMHEPRTRPMGIGLQLAGRHKSGREFPVEINLSPLQTADGLFVSAVIRKARA